MADARADLQSKWASLQNLKNLLHSGFITKTEYQERQSQLVDDLTGTTISTFSTVTKKRKYSENCPVIVPRGPPDFSNIEPENAIKFTFDFDTWKWKEERIKILLDSTPFARGSLRLVYHMKDLSTGEAHSGVTLVAKISMDPRDNASKDIYRRDVEMQAVARHYASMFNHYGPPKKVDFVKAHVLQLLNREGSPMVNVEVFIDGPYRKHNNNYGYVSEEERNTPQAFSHFTYEASKHRQVVCDIQGVSDCYTDPQIHCADGRVGGKGNLGQKGIDKFLQTHKCNNICRYLKLPPINANYENIGTLPMTQVMHYERIKFVNIYDGKNIPNQFVGISQRTPLLDTPQVKSRCPCTLL